MGKNEKSMWATLSMKICVAKSRFRFFYTSILFASYFEFLHAIVNVVYFLWEKRGRDPEALLCGREGRTKNQIKTSIN
jgi:hypothetical protein